jgi:4-hydroxybenzoate polyprenyltransferase
VTVFFIYQQWLIRAREPAACLRAFLNNHYVGMAIFIGIVLEFIYRTP